MKCLALLLVLCAVTAHAQLAVSSGQKVVIEVKNQYVVVNPSSSILYATATSVAAATPIDVTAISGGYTLKNDGSGQFTSADNNGANALVANRGTASSWETFAFTKYGSTNTYTLTAVNGKWVTLQSDNSLIATTTATGTPPATALFQLFAPSSVTSTAAPTSAPSSSGKRGLAMNGSSVVADIALITSSKFSWYYTWSPNPISGVPSKFTFVPMLWGTNGATSFVSQVTALKSKIAIGFNEPDNSGQSNLTPAQAVPLWQNNIQPLHAQGVQLVSPCVTNGPSGSVWLQQFIAQCTGCTIDAICLHWYADIPATNNYLQTYVQSFYTNYSKPIWITEFANNDASLSQDASFLTNNLAWLDSQSWIHNYAYFGFFRGTGPYNLVSNAGGSLSPIGVAYNS